MSSLEDIKNEFKHIYEDFLSKRGFPPILGRIIAVFYIEGRELSQHEISMLTGYSISSVSRALEQLIQMGALYKRKDPRSLRQYVYYVNIDLSEMIFNGLDVYVLNLSRSLAEIRDLVQEITAYNQESETEEGARIERALSNFERSMAYFLDVLKEFTEKLRSNKMKSLSL